MKNFWGRPGGLKAFLAGIIVFGLVTALWLVRLAGERTWALRDFSNYQFLACALAGAVAGAAWPSIRAAWLGGFVCLLGTVLTLAILPAAARLSLPWPRFLLSRLGHILAFSLVGFCAAAAVRRLREAVFHSRRG